MKTVRYGWLVINEFLNTSKYTELYEWFVRAASEYNIRLTVKTNAELLTSDIRKCYEEEQIEFVLFWDKDIRLAQLLESIGAKVFNSAKAIEACDDKSYSYILLKQAGIPMPNTVLGPKTFEGINYPSLGFLEGVEERLGYPVVLKECYGSFGQQVYLIENREELVEKVTATSPKPILFQEFIRNSFARDLRLQVVGEEVVATMYRYSETGDFRANITNGGKMKYYEPSAAEIKVAVDSCKALGLDFGGVDILFGENQVPLVCEVNSNAHFRNIYDCTSVNVAKRIMNYIAKKL